MARNIQNSQSRGPQNTQSRGPSKSPSRTTESRTTESGSEVSSDGDEQNTAAVDDAPRRAVPLKPVRQKTGIDTRPGEERDKSVEAKAVRSAAKAGRQGLAPTGRIPRISFQLKTTAGPGSVARSAEEMLLEYVSPQLQEPILQPGLALRLLATLLSKVLPELKGNPNILSPASTVMDDEKRRFSDLRARFNEQGLPA